MKIVFNFISETLFLLWEDILVWICTCFWFHFRFTGSSTITWTLLHGFIFLPIEIVFNFISETLFLLWEDTSVWICTCPWFPFGFSSSSTFTWTLVYLPRSLWRLFSISSRKHYSSCEKTYWSGYVLVFGFISDSLVPVLSLLVLALLHGLCCMGLSSSFSSQFHLGKHYSFSEKRYWSGYVLVSGFSFRFTGSSTFTWTLLHKLIFLPMFLLRLFSISSRKHYSFCEKTHSTGYVLVSGFITDSLVLAQIMAPRKRRMRR
jgi:hypothetical protein